MLEQLFDLLLFPGQLLGVGEVLILAAAAFTEQRALWLDPRRRCLQDLDQIRLAVVLVIAEHPRADTLVRQGEGDENHPAVVGSGEPLSHVGQLADVEFDFLMVIEWPRAESSGGGFRACVGHWEEQGLSRKIEQFAMGKSKRGRSGEMAPGCLVLFALPFAAVGVGMSVLTLVTLMKGHKVQAWEEVPAIILSASLDSRSDSDGTTYKAEAEYQYEYRGETYRGDRVSLHGGADNIGSFQQDAARELSRYQKSGEPFRCFVDPDEPSESVLYRELRGGMVLFYAVFAVTFGGAGFGLITWGLVSRRKARVRADRLEQQPDEPWLVRDDWAAGMIEYQSGAAFVPLLVVTAFINIVAWPVLFAVVIPQLGSGNWLALFGLLFPLAGVVTAAYAARSWARRRKYGATRFEMASVPGVLGGRLAGVVHVPQHVEARGGFTETLRCIRREVTRRGDSDSVRENVLWEAERKLTNELLPGDRSKTAVPVLFEIPFDQPESSPQASRSSVLWRLEVAAETTGADFVAKYEIPVFRTAESSPDFVLDDSAVASLTSPVDPRSDFAREKVRMERDVSGGTSITFPPGRYFGAAAALTVFWVIWMGVVVFLWKSNAPFIFPLVFGGFGVLLTFGVASLWLSTRRLRIAPDGLWVSSGWGVRGRERRIGYEELGDLEVGSDTQVGNTLYYHVSDTSKGWRGKKLTGTLRSPRLAHWIAGEIEAAAKRHRGS